MSKLERLLNLTAVLLETRRPLTAAELREQVEGYPEADASFRRAFERDKDDLRTLGIPLRLERVPGLDPPVDGYRIPPDEYYLADPGLDPDELAALHLATLTVRVEADSSDPLEAGREALWKLGGLGGEGPAPDQIASLPSEPGLTPLFGAISARTRVRFPYRGETRTVDPWRLSFQRGRWYLSGWDVDRADERSFRLDRMDGVPEVLDDPATTAPAEGARGRTLAAWELGEDDPEMVGLVVDADHVAVTASQLGPDVAQQPVGTEGAVRFDVPVVNRAAFRSYVLGLLEHAEVVEPADFRADIIAWLEAIEAGR